MEGEGSGSGQSNNENDPKSKEMNTEPHELSQLNDMASVSSDSSEAATSQMENIESNNGDVASVETQTNNDGNSTRSNDARNVNSNKRSRSRFAGRNYRLRIDSSSSSSPDLHPVAESERNDEPAEPVEVNMELVLNVNDSDGHSIATVTSNSSSVSLINISDSDDSDNNDSEQSALSTDRETKINDVLNKPSFSSNFCFAKNFYSRQAGLMSNGNKQRNDLSSTAFLNRLHGSHFAVERLHLMTKLEHHDGCVNSLNFNKSGTLLASGSDDRHVVVWNWSKKTPVHVIRTSHLSNVFQTKFADDLSTGPNALNIITSARDGYVRQITIRPGGGDPVDRLLARHSEEVHKVTLPETSQDEVLTAGEDAVVMRIDLRERKPEKLLCLRVNKTRVPLYSIAAHPFDPEFCVAGKDRFVRVYDRRNLKDPLRSYCPNTILKKKTNFVNITCAVYNALGTEILASYSHEDPSENIYLFDNKNETLGNFLHSYSGHKNRMTIKGINFFGPRSEFVISGSDCGNIFIWDKDTESIVQWLRGDDEGAVNCLEGHPRFPILTTSGLDHDIKVFSPTKENQLSRAELKKCVTKNVKNDDDDYDEDFGRSIIRYFATRFGRVLARRRNNENESSSEASSDEFPELDLDHDDSSDSDGVGANLNVFINSYR